jgi:hypothetical protein
MGKEILLTPHFAFFSLSRHHFGLLKARLARLRAQLLEPTTKSGKGEGFEVQKSGDARVCIIGFVLNRFISSEAKD